jgi:hypothetical protein
MFSDTPIDCVCVDDNEAWARQFDALYRCKRPFVIKHCVLGHWTACERWQSNQALSHDAVVTVHQARDNHNFQVTASITTDRMEMQWSDVVDVIFGSRPAATPSAESVQHMPTAGLHVDGSANDSVKAVDSVKDAQQYKRLYMKSSLNSAWMADITPLPDHVFRSTHHTQQQRILNDQLAQVWIGSQGNITPLHFDMCHAVISQVRGRKSALLVAPSDSHNVYPFSRASPQGPRCSRVDVVQWRSGNQQQLTRFERVSLVTFHTCVLDEGDLLYIPPFWWHAIEAVDSNISILTPFDMSKDEQRAAQRPWTMDTWGLDEGVAL